MKKMNKKGFVLVETLIVTVFVVTLFILVYQVTVPTMGEYERLFVYDDIDSIYASNLYKQMLTHYGNISYIDNQLTTHTYFDASDCSNENVYIDQEYCELIKRSIGVLENDKIIITKYNLSEFRDEVNRNEFFDSGNLSNFRSYIATIPDVEKLSGLNTYGFDYNGKYRLFLTRTIIEADGTKSRRYVNIGVYAGSYDKYLMGEKVYFNPVDDSESGKLEFYVLKNSPSTEEKISLILASNLENSNVCFSEEFIDNVGYNTGAVPTSLLENLKEKTSTWTKALLLNGYSYTSVAGYTINYNGYRARLLDENDIVEVLGCKKYGYMCFAPDEAFEVGNGVNTLGFLLDNLTGSNGYWTGMSLPNSSLYAWSIKENVVKPTFLTDCKDPSKNTVGIRPIVVANKADVSR